MTSPPRILGTSGGMTSTTGVVGARSAAIDKVPPISPGVGGIGDTRIFNGSTTTMTLALVRDWR